MVNRASVMLPAAGVVLAFAAVAPAADHFKCYRARETSQPRFQSRTVTLADQFGSGSTSVIVPSRFCNPASKNGEGITDPTAHLMCYRIVDAVPSARRNIPIRNQFGDQTLAVSGADSLCVPAAKDGVPVAGPLNHFKCYHARPAGERFQRRNVTLGDEFEFKTMEVTKPKLFCNPVDKNGEGIPNPDDHLTCYRIKDANEQVDFAPQPVSVVDQFAEQDLRALRGTCRKAAFLCVPTIKNPPTTTTTTTTTSTVPTTVPLIRCCLPSSPGGAFDQCEQIPGADCASRGGVDLGPGTCEPDTCPPTTTTTASTTTTTTLPPIVCCLPSSPGGPLDQCQEMLSADCTSQGGVDLGPGTCQPDTCPPSTTTTTTTPTTTTTSTTATTTTTSSTTTTTTPVCTLDLLLTAEPSSFTSNTECKGGIRSITFRYVGGGCGASNNPQGGKASCSGVATPPEPVNIEGKSKAGTVTLAGVMLGDVIFISPTSGADLTMKIIGASGTETSKIHISCSQPIAPGDRFGSLEVVSFTSKDAGFVGGTSVTYTYKVTNTGTTTVDDVSVDDDRLGHVCDIPSLAPGAMQTCTASDVVLDTTTNTATASAHVQGVPAAVCEDQADTTVTKTEPPRECTSAIVAFLVEYTGPTDASITSVQFTGLDGASITYSLPGGLTNGDVLALDSDPGPPLRPWTIDATDHNETKLGTRTNVLFNGVLTEVFHTSCSCPQNNFVPGLPACLDATSPDNPTDTKGEPSPLFRVLDFK